MARFLTVRQTADYLSLSNKAVYALVSKGLPHYRIGGAIRISKDQLKQWLEEQKGGGAEAPPSRCRASLTHLRL